MNAKLGGLSLDETRKIVADFLDHYNGNIPVKPMIKNLQEEIYGPEATVEKLGFRIEGAYHAHRGLFTLAASNLHSEEAVKRTIRHELLGHYGLNTFKPEEKRSLLVEVLNTRQEPSLNHIWQRVEKDYQNEPDLFKAEEVFAFVAEEERTFLQRSWDKVASLLQKTLRASGLSNSRLTLSELRDEAAIIAKGIREGRLQQQTFPISDHAQFRIKENDSMDNKKPYFELVAEKIIEQLEKGVAPWQKPWKASELSENMPYNPESGTVYKGINSMFLMAQGQADPRWLTYVQAQKQGYQVKHNEKGTLIQYWKFSEERNKKDENGKTQFNEDGQPAKERILLERPKVFYATVFNASQIEGIPPIERKPIEWDINERAENILNASDAKITHHAGDVACYRPQLDDILLPHKDTFVSAEKYYETATHELGHWTGHKTRLDRNQAEPFGSEGYAREELRAEIASLMLSKEIGLGHDPGNHAAYVQSWIKILKEEPLEIMRAAADAEKIKDFILNLERVNRIEIEITEKLKEIHSNSIEGYSPLASWENIKAKANEFGLVATIKQGEENEAPFLINYAREGRETAITSEMYNDGKAVTSFEGRRISGTGLTSDLTWQADALENAWASLLRKEQQLNANQEQIANAVIPDIKQATPELTSSYTVQNRRMVPENAAAHAGENAVYVQLADGRRAWGFGTDEIAAEKAAVVRAENIVIDANHALKQDALHNQLEKPMTSRTYLAVPYIERYKAAKAGAEWDKEKKCWYAGENADMVKLEQWLPKDVKQEPVLSPREEFTKALVQIGAVISGGSDHPIMDGKKHRIEVIGDKDQEKSGFYVGHLDGVPAGYMINNRTKDEVRWKQKGYFISESDKDNLTAIAAQKAEERKRSELDAQENAKKRIIEKLKTYEPITADGVTPYLKAKNISVHKGIFTDKSNENTYIPGVDANGSIQTLQTINKDGIKRFAKDAKKEGCFHPIGGRSDYKSAPAIVIAEGYSTAATLTEALGFACISAFDSGNLLPVAKALREAYPDKQIFICGDDDRHLEASLGKNPGIEKAKEAALAVGGKAIFPIFAPQEQLNNPKQFTDFNDLANSSVLGFKAVQDQVKAVIGSEPAKRIMNEEKLEQTLPKKRQRSR